MIRYFEFDHIKNHENTLKELFDLNFGKDWRIFLLLYYSGPLCRHHCRYAPFDSAEDANLSWVKRKAYFARAKLILKTYFSKGYESTLEEIKSDKHRFVWDKQYVISSSIFDLSVQKKLEKKSEEKEDLVEEEEVEKQEKEDLVEEEEVEKQEKKVKKRKKQEKEDIVTKYYECCQEQSKVLEKIRQIEGKDTLSESDWAELEILKKEDQRWQSKIDVYEIQINNSRKPKKYREY